MINPVPRGSKVGIVSPSSALDSPEDIRDGLRWLESCGYRVVLGTHVYDRLNHMAGTPEQQAEDLMRFFADPEIKAVFAAAGGFGAQYLLPLLDYDLIRKNPKPLIGFSDTTALQAGIFARTDRRARRHHPNINYIKATAGLSTGKSPKICVK